VETIQFDNNARLEAREPSGPVPANPGALSSRTFTGTAAESFRSGQLSIVLVEPRAFLRDCLAERLSTASGVESVHAFARASDFANARASRPVSALILLGGADCDKVEIEHEIEVLTKVDASASLVLLADNPDSRCILGALDKGVRGVIPTSMAFDVALKALLLVGAGGTFVPAECFRARKAIESHGARGGGTEARVLFTARQLAVIDALRQGKANKVIAYELNMQESTVKVHVRNIMKKLQAKNRTEVAFRVRAMPVLDKVRDGL
jgi:DNA-binding NarL/FixJ family response regulator